MQLTDTDIMALKDLKEWINSSISDFHHNDYPQTTMQNIIADLEDYGTTNSLVCNVTRENIWNNLKKEYRKSHLNERVQSFISDLTSEDSILHGFIVKQDTNIQSQDTADNKIISYAKGLRDIYDQVQQNRSDAWDATMICRQIKRLKGSDKPILQITSDALINDINSSSRYFTDDNETRKYASDCLWQVWRSMDRAFSH